MSKKEALRIRNSLAPFFQIVLVIACLGMLASCGGGGGGSATATTTGTPQTASGIPSFMTTSKNDVITTAKGMKVIRGRFIAMPASGVTFTAVSQYVAQNGWTIVEYDTGGDADTYQINTPAATDADFKSIRAKMKNSGLFIAVTPNTVGQLNYMPTESDYTSNSNREWNLKAASIDKAWDLMKSASNLSSIKVADIDAGFRGDHINFNNNGLNALANIYYSSPDVQAGLCSDIADQTPGDATTLFCDADHGMHTAGIIMASGKNGVGMAGIANTIETSSISGYVTNVNDQGTVISSIKQAILNGEKVINLSIGFNSCDNYNLCDESDVDFISTSEDNKLIILNKIGRLAIQNDVLIIQSSGNGGAQANNAGTISPQHADLNGLLSTAVGDGISIPSNIINPSIISDLQQHVIIVGAYSQSMSSGKISLASYTQLPSSNAGSGFPFILAPGGGVNFKENLDIPGVYSTRYYGDGTTHLILSGTSMAAPHVTGVAALLWQVNSKLTASQIQNIILTNSDTISGYPALNAQKAVQAALNYQVSPTVGFTVSPNPTAGVAVSFQSQVSLSNSLAPVKSYSWNFGDGSSTVTTQNASHTYATAGSYTVTLTVADANGNTGNASQSVVVSPVTKSQPSIDSLTPNTIIGPFSSPIPFVITGNNLPNTALSVSFPGCLNITFVEISTSSQTFTCTPTASGFISVGINAPDNSISNNFTIETDGFLVSQTYLENVYSSGAMRFQSKISFVVQSQPSLFDSAVVSGIGTGFLPNGAIQLIDVGTSYLSSTAPVSSSNGTLQGIGLILPPSLGPNDIQQNAIYTAKFYLKSQYVGSLYYSMPIRVLAPSELNASMFPTLLFTTYSALCPNNSPTTAQYYLMPTIGGTVPSNIVPPSSGIICNLPSSTPFAFVEVGYNPPWRLFYTTLLQGTPP